MLIAQNHFWHENWKGTNQTLKKHRMELKLIYDLLKIKAEKLMKSGDVAAYLRTLARINEIKVSLATA